MCDNSLMIQHVPSARAGVGEMGYMHIIGRVVWQCGYCGSINSRYVRACTWKVKCPNRNCRRVMTWAMHPVPSGYASRAPGLTLMAILSNQSVPPQSPPD